MALSNAERQRRYKERLKMAATPSWIRKDYGSANEAREVIKWFIRFFGELPSPGSLRLYSRDIPDTGGISLLAKLPWPMTEEDGDMMKGWRPAREDAEDLGYWQEQI